MIGLTTRQMEALRFIAGYVEAKGVPPSYDEIAAAMGTHHRSAVFKITKALRERGAITWRPNRARAIEVLRPVTIPRLADGTPLYSVAVQQ
jgi:SOS-response transcriptional repressor LexA